MVAFFFFILILIKFKTFGTGQCLTTFAKFLFKTGVTFTHSNHYFSSLKNQYLPPLSALHMKTSDSCKIQ
jgi:hypothetical protein